MPPREIVLHMDVAEVLRDHALPEWLWAHSERRAPRHQNRGEIEENGSPARLAGLHLISPFGSTRFLELKREGEDLTDDQEQLRFHCIRQAFLIRLPVRWTRRLPLWTLGVACASRSGVSHERQNHSLPERKTPPIAEFPDGYDAGIIFNALVVYRNDGLYSLVAPVQRSHRL